MLERVQVALDELNKTDWFCHVGVQDTDAAMVLGSWKKALDSSQSRKWNDVRLEAANQYCESLVERSMERWSEWNNVVRAGATTGFSAVVKKKTKEVVRENGLPKEFVEAVRWDIIQLCMETAYADVYPPGFFTDQAGWYLRGHFPCGWKGKYPGGTPVVY